jgi:putative membrane protein
MKSMMIGAALLCAAASSALAAPLDTKGFVSKVAVANKYEIDTGELGIKYAKDGSVKSFAQMMVDDHTKAGEEFKAAVKEAKLDPPSETLDVTHTAKYAKLRVFTTEAGFDAAYVKDGVAAHEDTVATFKDFAANGEDGPVKDFAKKTLPKLEHHLSMVKDLEGKMK